jgi:hypothetical protein
MDIKLVVGIINIVTKKKKGNQHVTVIRVLATDTLKIVPFPQYRENIKKKKLQKKKCNRCPINSLNPWVATVLPKGSYIDKKKEAYSHFSSLMRPYFTFIFPPYQNRPSNTPKRTNPHVALSHHLHLLHEGSEREEQRI